MTDEFKDVDELIEAMQERGRTLEPLRLASFEEMMATVRRMRRRRRIIQGAIALAAAGIAAAVVALMFGGEPSPAAGESATPIAGRAIETPSRGPDASELRRMEPFPDVVAFACAGTEVAFPSPERVVLTSGILALQFRGVGSGSGLVIETPAATVAITGTVLSVSVEAGGTGVDVLRGRVEVTREGQTIVVGEGQQLRAGAAAPELLSKDRLERLAVLFPDERLFPPVTAMVPAAPTGVSALETGSAVRASPPQSPVAEHPVAADATPPGSDVAVLDVDEIYRLAEEALRARRYGEARELLTELLAKLPAGSGREETALIDLARTCGLLGDAACARESLVRYLDRHPSGALREEARIDLCRVLEQSGTTPELRSCLEDYLVEFPEGRKAPWARELLGDSPSPSPEGDGV
ncbi:MAG: FecR domain-containing protein [Deltaproteobacteria bacterium]|nr:FecR domain-containing protein [Deltaproteobacteria bacterium]